MKKLWVYLKEYKIESILAPLFKLLEVVFDLLVPVVVAKIIDIGIANNDHGYIVKMFLVLILMAAVGLSCSFTAQYFAARASVGCATNLRQAVFDHIQGFSFTELDTIGTDTLITRMTDDINQVQNGINMGLRLLLRSPFIVIGSMIMAFTINFKCALVFVVAIPLLFVGVIFIMLVSIPLFKKVQGRLDAVTRLTRENLTGVRVIRAFCREELLPRLYPQGVEELRRRHAEGAEVLTVDRERIAQMGIELVERPLASPSGDFARHDPDALASAVLDIYRARAVHIYGGRESYRIEK